MKNTPVLKYKPFTSFYISKKRTFLYDGDSMQLFNFSNINFGFQLLYISTYVYLPTYICWEILNFQFILYGTGTIPFLHIMCHGFDKFMRHSRVPEPVPFLSILSYICTYVGTYVYLFPVKDCSITTPNDMIAKLQESMHNLRFKILFYPKYNINSVMCVCMCVWVYARPFFISY